MDLSTLENRIEISWAACPRWATSESADLVDVVEQLGSQWAAVLIDVQGSGAGGRRLAANLMRMTRESLAAGLTPKTAVLSVHEHLFSLRHGRVGASIHVCSIDSASGLVSIAGLGKLTVAALRGGSWEESVVQGPLAGFTRDAGVDSLNIALQPGGALVIANDGAAHEVDDLSRLLDCIQVPLSRSLDARSLLAASIERDSGRPRADMAIVTIALGHDDGDGRMLHARVSVPVKRTKGET